MALWNHPIRWIAKWLCPFQRCTRRIEDCASSLRQLVSQVGDLNTALSDVSRSTGTIAAASHDASTSATEIMATIATAATDVNNTLGAAIDCVKELKNELSAIKTELSDCPVTFRIYRKGPDETIISIQPHSYAKKKRAETIIDRLVSFFVPIVFVVLIVFACFRIGQCSTVSCMKENGISVVGIDGSEKVFTFDKGERPKQPLRFIQEN